MLKNKLTDTIDIKTDIILNELLLRFTNYVLVNKLELEDEREIINVILPENVEDIKEILGISLESFLTDETKLESESLVIYPNTKIITVFKSEALEFCQTLTTGDIHSDNIDRDIKKMMYYSTKELFNKKLIEKYKDNIVESQSDDIYTHLLDLRQHKGE